MKHGLIRRQTRREEGAALLVVLVFLVIIGAWSTSFIWFMNQQQTRAGMRYRSAVAARLAEAGVQRALSILESTAPDGSPGRTWRPDTYTESMAVGTLAGQFTLSLRDETDGAVVIVSSGEVGGVARRLQARVYLASPALLAGLYAAWAIRLRDPPAATVILPYGAGLDDRPWIHLASGREVWFATTQVSINDPATAFEAGPGPLDPADSAQRTIPLPSPASVRILLPPSGYLRLGEDRQPVDVQQLRVMGVHVEGTVIRTGAFPQAPEVDASFYRALAAANHRNAELNEAVGNHVGDANLLRKQDSLYTARQFEQLQVYLKSREAPSQLFGVIYVRGGVSLLDGERLEIVDGALIADSTVYLSARAELSITHRPATRTLPGLIVLGNGALFVTEGARLRVHGLVYSSRNFEIGPQARVDIVGSVVAKDPGPSFQNRAGTVVIRYDPAVLGTPGLHVPEDTPVIAWVAVWEELQPTLVPQVPPVVARATPTPLRTLVITPPPTPAATRAPAPRSPATPAALRTLAIAPLPATPTPPPAPAATRAPTPDPPATAGTRTLYRVQAGAFLTREYAQERVHQLKAAGFDAYILPAGELFKVYVGAFGKRENAERLVERLRAAGFETLIVTQ